MSKIHLKSDVLGSSVKVNHKGLNFTYFVADKMPLTLAGRRYKVGTKELVISSTGGNSQASIRLGGKQI